MNILLTGGSGFVGRAFLEELARLDDASVRVRALLRRPNAVPPYRFVDTVIGSLERLPPQLEPDGPYVLVHFAVKNVDRDGSGFLETNVDATDALLRSLGRGLRGVIYASSMSVYGQGAQDGVSEGAPLRPETPLAVSRHLAETRIAAFAESAKVDAIVMRPRFILGREDRALLPYFVKLARWRLAIGPGTQRFSIIDVSDYARIITALVRRLTTEGPTGTVEALHMAYERPVSFSEILNSVRTATEIGAPLLRLPASPGLTRVLQRSPWARARAEATRLELLGWSHWGRVDALARRVGRELVGRDPREVVAAAASRLTPPSTATPR